MHFLVDETGLIVGSCADKSKCYCLIFMIYGLSYACMVAKKIENNTRICLEKIYTH